MDPLYTPKEISWLSFNERVLQEASDCSVPLANRIKFLGIYSSNLDEFFRVRVATLKGLARIGKSASRLIHNDPKEILEEVDKIVKRQGKRFDEIYRSIEAELQKKNIYVINDKEYNDDQQQFVKSYFERVVRPRLFPIMITNRSKTPELMDKTIYLAVSMEKTNSRAPKRYSIIEIPTDAISRFIVLPKSGGKNYVTLIDDIIRAGLSEIFISMNFDKFEAYTFKITRNAELDIEDDFSGSYVEKVSKSLQKRKQGNLVRIVYDAKMPDSMRSFLMRKLKIHNTATLIAGGRYHNFKDFMDFPDVVSIPEKKEKNPPQLIHKMLKGKNSIMDAMEGNDIMIHTPYQSFDSVIDLLREASINPKVESIKITLYRLAKHSAVVNALINAIKNGKSVTAVIELQARFDEESNIYWANRLKEEGANVIFGVKGLKVHSKVCLITKNDKGKSAKYAVIGTGNFHEITAKLYTDQFLLTTKDEYTRDSEKLFEFFKNNYKHFNFKHLIVSPFNIRKRLYSMVDKEIENAQKGEEAEIFIKINNLSDYDIVQKLYEASKAGVRVRLIGRSMFSIVTEQKGVSDNIEAVSIVDKYLEHSRILCFYNGGDPLYFIASADWLPRNLDKRVEVTCPIYDEEIKEELRRLMELQWADNVKSRILDANLSNEYRKTGSRKKLRAQNEIYKYLQGEHGESI